MQKLSEDHGVRTVARALRFVTFRLRTHGLAEPIAAEMDFCVGELAQAGLAREQAHTERLAATAEVRYRDELVDEAVTTLAAEVLRLVNSDREDPRYVALFPVSPVDAIASTAGNRQHEFVQNLITKLETSPHANGLSTHAQKLKTRQLELEQAMKDRERCFAAEGSAHLRQTEVLDLACRVYNRSFSRLQLAYPDGLLIESMFPALIAGRRVDDDPARRLA